MEDPQVYEWYKPLRNHLRLLRVDESLYTLWAFSLLAQFETPLPPDIENPFRYSTRNALQFDGHMLPWEIEVLTKEVIINSHESIGTKTLRIWDYLSGAFNKLKALENEISGKYISTDNVLLELNRIAHRQFTWQGLRPNQRMLTRYYILYSYQPLNSIIEEIFSLSAGEISIIGTALLSKFLKHPASIYPLNVELKNLTIHDFDKFLAHFSTDIVNLKTKLIDEQEYNDQFAYAYNSLRASPIIRMRYNHDTSIVCPLPTLLYWRFTSGVYYEICNHPKFDNAFGFSFQRHVGDTLQRAISNYKIYPEQQYQVHGQRKDTVDWMIESDAVVFIECKTRRMSYSGKTTLTEQIIDNEIEKMLMYVMQVYHTILDYKSNLYPNMIYDPDKPIYPLIVTLEDWYFFGDKTYRMLNDKVKKQFEIEGISETLLEKSPYSICSIDELDSIAQVVNLVGVNKVFQPKTSDKQLRTYQFQPYIHDKFVEEMKQYRFLFKKEWEQIYAEYIPDSK